METREVASPMSRSRVLYHGSYIFVPYVFMWSPCEEEAQLQSLRPPAGRVFPRQCPCVLVCVATRASICVLNPPPVCNRSGGTSVAPHHLPEARLTMMEAVQERRQLDQIRRSIGHASDFFTTEEMRVAMLTHGDGGQAWTNLQRGGGRKAHGRGGGRELGAGPTRCQEPPLPSPFPPLPLPVLGFLGL